MSKEVFRGLVGVGPGNGSNCVGLWEWTELSWVHSKMRMGGTEGHARAPCPCLTRDQNKVMTTTR